MSVAAEVAGYLAKSLKFYEVGQHEYYARIALEQAATSLAAGNYGIGAVAVVVGPRRVREFHAQNAMFSGKGVVDHAETRALIDVRSGRSATTSYARKLTRWTQQLPEGISLFGTLEPCPMCACTLTNAGAKLSISTVEDGKLVETDGIKHSDGAANVLDDKGKLQPAVWRQIQRTAGLEFQLLQTEDEELVDLSRRIFESTRQEIDEKLAQRGTGSSRL